MDVGQDILVADVLDMPPSGTILMWAGPTGTSTAVAIQFPGTATGAWLHCTGTAVSRTTYAKLFGVIGTTFGVGNNSTTFNLPDLRGRIPLGAGLGEGDEKTGTATGTPTGTPLSLRILGEWGGEQNHRLLTAELAAHTHVITQSNQTNSGGSANQGVYTATLQNSPLDTGSSGSGTPHPNLQPFLVLNFIIKS